MKVTYLNTLVCWETSVRESFLLPLLKPLQRICPLYPWYLSYNPSTKMEAKKSPFIFFLHCCLLGEDLDPNPAGILDIAIPTESTGIKAVQHLTECGLPIPKLSSASARATQAKAPAVTRGSCSKDNHSYLFHCLLWHTQHSSTAFYASHFFIRWTWF